MKPFDVVRQPLQKGVTLIEASAGTGKTYAIAMLVLRFVVELELDIEKILIVTFTRAATAELRERVRQRLVQARDLLDASNSSDADPVLQKWATTIPPKQYDQAITRLRLAIANIDQAGIFTIHGFCQRMLGECALESASVFDSELRSNVDDTIQQITDDFWRKHLYSASEITNAIIAKIGKEPESFFGSINRALATNAPIIPKVYSLEHAERELRSTVQNLCDWWSANGANLYNQYEADERQYFNGDMAGWRNTAKKIADIQPDKPIPSDLHFFDGAFLKQNFLDSIAKKKTPLLKKKPVGDIGIDTFLARYDLPPVDQVRMKITQLAIAYRRQLAEELREELPLRMEAAGTLSFNDLIYNLASALAHKEGKLLQHRLASRFSAALIDEFQDTDSNQYSIFSRLFAGSNHRLYLIGDPKQAIYSFRDADIYSYFEARQHATEQCTLDKNYRSHPNVVDEVNRLFSSQSHPFRYDQETLPFFPVESLTKKDSDYLTKSGEAGRTNGFEYWLLPKEGGSKWSSSAAQDEIRPHIVTEIQRLLTENWQLHKGGDSHESRPLAPQDIAVLVRTNKVAAAYANAIADAGIPAVVTSQESVFLSEECRELLLLMQAIVLPAHIQHFRGAMTVSWFELDGNELHRIYNDEEEFGNWRAFFHKLLQIWQDDSFFAMMTALFDEKNVMKNLAIRQRGERAISNIRQLLTLAQQEAQTRRLKPLELLHWLERCRSSSHGAEAELLLESDSAAVQILTVHKAKGLEYSIVFCPDLWLDRDYTAKEQYQIKFHQEHNERREEILDFGSEDFDHHKRDALQEHDAEGMRLLYVALTRAKLRCYVIWAACKKHAGEHLLIRDSFSSPLGWLLFGGEECSQEKQVEKMQRIHNENSRFRLLKNEQAETPFSFSFDKQELAARPTVRGIPRPAWQIASFSKLARLSDYEYDGSLHTSEKETEPEHDEKGGQEIPVVGLPAGTHFGNVVHTLLEEFPFTQLASFGRHHLSQNADADFTIRCNQLCNRYGIQVQSEKMAQLLAAVVSGTLTDTTNGISFSLSQLDSRSAVAEMEFYMKLAECETQQLGKILAECDPAVAHLDSRTIKGYLTGFIDLVCKYQERYYLLDYKSNFLGNRMANYGKEALIPAMRQHNYGLQYWIYTVVLHRWLQDRIDNYSYGNHFGGVFYLFVRGMRADSQNGVFATQPDIAILQELDTIL